MRRQLLAVFFAMLQCGLVAAAYQAPQPALVNNNKLFDIYNGNPIVNNLGVRARVLESNGRIAWCQPILIPAR